MDSLSMENTKLTDNKNNGVIIDELKEIPAEIRLLMQSSNSSKIKGAIFGGYSINLNTDGTLPKQGKSNSLTNQTSNEYNTRRSKNSDGGDGGMSDLERRVENLEYQNRKMQEQLDDIKQQTFMINSKLENSVTKVDLMQLQNSITQSIQDAIKPLPNENAVKAIFEETISNKKLTTETKVENIVMNSNKGLIKWIIGTGIATIGVIATIIKLFM